MLNGSMAARIEPFYIGFLSRGKLAPTPAITVYSEVYRDCDHTTKWCEIKALTNKRSPGKLAPTIRTI
ncbi:hypothetical protein PPE03_11060 [Pseudoalteromonas peptidolytica]|nr:hypothetical protein PPE03_11060 [Pseudoalteromonas peptidolytica]